MSENFVEMSFVNKLQKFWNQNQKKIVTILLGLVVVIGGWWAYQEFLVKPKNEKAADIIFKAEEYFAQDSSRKVLDGDGINKGVLYVIKNHSGTPSANLAHYYAGVSYLKLGEFNKAVEQLKEFSSDSKALQATAYASLGHAYSELGKKQEAADYYIKAGKQMPENENMSAEYLWLAGQLYETMNKNKEALELYKEIKTSFPNSSKAYSIDKDIYKLSIEKNDFSVK
jgi:tetratricopeptide (TPR) repeat protein